MSLKWSWLLAFVLGVSCAPLGAKSPTDVARGEYYAAGKPAYDRFFVLLYEKQVELLAAPLEPRAARAGLATALGLAPTASNEALATRLGREAQQLASQGLRLRVEVPPPSPTVDASVTLYASETSTPTALRAALPLESTRLVRSRNRMRSTKVELEQLRVLGISLEGNVDRAFLTEGPWKREEVRDNLTDAQKLITLMLARAGEVEQTASDLLGAVATAASTDPTLGQAAAEPAPEEAPKPRRPSARSASSPRPSSGTKPAAGAVPPSPKRTAEEEPAPPRPTQGSAPAEIEP